MSCCQSLRVRVLAILAASLALPAVGTADGKPLKIVARWQQGEKRVYVRAKSRTRTRDGKIQTGGARTDVTIEVSKVGKTGIVLSWTYGKTIPNDPTIVPTPDLKRALDLSTDVRIRLKLDPEGTLEGIENTKELKTRGAKIVDAILDLRKGLTAEQRDRLRQQLREVMLSDAAIQQVWGNEPQLFLNAHGLELSLAKPIRRKVTLPLPIGGGAVAANLEVKLKSLDRKNHTAVITMKQEIDPMEGARMVNQLLKKVAGKELPVRDSLKHLRISDSTEIVIDTNSGWPIRVEHTRIGRILGATQRDVITFTRKPVKAARPVGE